MERRRGMPILLASLWVLVARAAGLRADGVGLPGHFIARVGGPDGVLVDPFAGGAPLSQDDCRALVSKLLGDRAPWRDEMLAATPTDQTVQRVLRNLMGSFSRTGETTRLYRTVRLLALLAPGDADVHLAHARVAEEVGAVTLAEGLYREVGARFAGSGQAAAAQARLDELRATRRLLM
jgi:regulator of sirC expression with transglutaminase-like and TPR domain